MAFLFGTLFLEEDKLRGLESAKADLSQMSPARDGTAVSDYLPTPTVHVTVSGLPPLPPSVSASTPGHCSFPDLDHELGPIVEDEDAGWSRDTSEHGGHGHGAQHSHGNNHRFNSYTPYLSSTPMRHGGKVNDLHAIEQYVALSIRGEVTPGAQFKKFRRLYSKFK